MRKYFNYKLLSVVAIAFLMYSCDPDNPTEDPRSIKPLVSANQTSFNVAEGDPATITLTSTLPNKTSMEFKIALIGGTAGADEFTITPTEVGPTTILDGLGPDGDFLLKFPANTTSFTFDITPIFDLLPEGVETLQFALTSAGNGRGLVAPGSEIINISISNSVSNDLYTSLSWDGTYIGVDGEEHDYCEFDFDLEIYDAGLNVVANSYTECPEATTLDGTSPDGDYLIVPSFYSNAGVAPASGDISFPVKLTVAKAGAFVSVIDLSGIFTYAVGGVDQGNPDGYRPTATVTKTGVMYVVKDANDPTIIYGQGKIANLAQMLKKHSKKKK